MGVYVCARSATGISSLERDPSAACQCVGCRLSVVSCQMSVVGVGTVGSGANHSSLLGAQAVSQVYASAGERPLLAQPKLLPLRAINLDKLKALTQQAERLRPRTSLPQTSSQQQHQHQHQ